MMSLVLSLVTLLAAVSLCLGDDRSIKLMEEHQVVPDLIDTLPKDVLEVKYDSEKVDLGNVLTPTKVKNQPTVSWEGDSDAFYTLVMTDLDPPSRKDPALRAWQHWFVANIKGTDLSSGDVFSAYVGAGPPKGSGLHRYVLLLYRQSGKMEFDEPHLTNTSGANRANFSVVKFAKKHNLGDPIAGNFYQAEWDEYSEVIFKQLNGK